MPSSHSVATCPCHWIPSRSTPHMLPRFAILLTLSLEEAANTIRMTSWQEQYCNNMVWQREKERKEGQFQMRSRHDADIITPQGGGWTIQFISFQIFGSFGFPFPKVSSQFPFSMNNLSLPCIYYFRCHLHLSTQQFILYNMSSVFWKISFIFLLQSIHKFLQFLDQSYWSQSRKSGGLFLACGCMSISRSPEVSGSNVNTAWKDIHKLLNISAQERGTKEWLKSNPGFLVFGKTESNLFITLPKTVIEGTWKHMPWLNVAVPEVHEDIPVRFLWSLAWTQDIHKVLIRKRTM